MEALPVTIAYTHGLSGRKALVSCIILENQEIKIESTALPEPLEFVGDNDDEGRRDFSPSVPKDANAASGWYANGVRAPDAVGHIQSVTASFPVCDQTCTKKLGILIT